MTIKSQYSSIFSPKIRRKGEIKFIIIHYTGMQSKIAAIKRLTRLEYKVSCHYLIDREGNTIRMVDENKIAWHAGKSRWGQFDSLNKNSIGIELVNKGHEFGYEKFTSIQISSLIKLCLILKKKYKIKNSKILGHSDIAPLRKKDPGEKFPWNKLNKKKIGIWYKNLRLQTKKLNEKKIKKLFFENLFKIGYRYFDKKKRSKKDIFIIKAFQRHFLSHSVSGIIDQKTFKISHFLAHHIKN